MPRTKRTKRKVDTKNKNNQRDSFDSYCQVLEQTMLSNMKEAESEFDRLYMNLELNLKECYLKFPQHTMEKSIEEMKNIPVNNSHNTTRFKNTTLNSTTKSVRKGRNLSRSSSVEKLNELSTAKKVRGRPSRSISCNRPGLTSGMVTPLCGSNLPKTFGTVTPKVKPNMPQVLLRRPKQGEIAISMQGSPLMVNSVVSEEIANINIPLKSGHVVSIQPRRGLRESQIPEFDDETWRQIQTLRDNLIQVCQINSRD